MDCTFINALLAIVDRTCRRAASWEVVKSGSYGPASRLMKAASSLLGIGGSAPSPLNELELDKEAEYRIAVTYVRPDVEARFINTYHVLIDEEMPLEKTMSKIKLAFTLAHPGWPILSIDACPKDGLPRPLSRVSLVLPPNEARRTTPPKVSIPCA